MRSVQVKSIHPPRGYRAPISQFAFSFLTLAMSIISLATTLPDSPLSTTTPSTLTLIPEDRVLVLAPHPDDETIACGGIIQKAVAMHLPVRVVFFTNGDNNEWSFMVYRKHAVLIPAAVQQMGLVRHDEALLAASALGLPPEALTFLGYPDFGTLHIWTSHWGDTSPYESMLTRVTRVPYKTAYRPGALYKGEEILSDLVAIIKDFKPTRIFVSHPADANTDHRALYLFTRVALWDIGKECHPLLYPYLVHYPNWPKPRGNHPAFPLQSPSLLASSVSWSSFSLDARQLSNKQAALEAHKSQYEYASHYLNSFLRMNELFGDFQTIVQEHTFTSATDFAKEPSDALHQENDPNPLTDEERSHFTGIEWRHIRIADSNLVIQVNLSVPLGKAVSLSAAACGYRHDVPFSKMPKLRIEIGSFDADVYDQSRQLPDSTIQVVHKSRDIEIHLPLKVLGNPQHILTSARTHLGELPLDSVSWRLIELPNSPDLPNINRNEHDHVQ